MAEYLEQTNQHIEVVRDLFEKFGLDAERQTPRRQVVRDLGEALVQAMQMAKESGKRETAELVACECVVPAETKDDQNWRTRRPSRNPTVPPPQPGQPGGHSGTNDMLSIGTTC